MFSTLVIAQKIQLSCDSELSCPLASEGQQAGPSSPLISHLCKYQSILFPKYSQQLW